MPELTPAQIAVLQRLHERGFAPCIFPLYENVIGMRRGAFAALLDPAEGKLRAIGEPFYVIDGNLSVGVEAEGRRWFVWKGKRIEATPELLEEQRRFAAELAAGTAS